MKKIILGVILGILAAPFVIGVLAGLTAGHSSSLKSTTKEYQECAKLHPYQSQPDGAAYNGMYREYAACVAASN